jgi:hypothetical protein
VQRTDAKCHAFGRPSMMAVKGSDRTSAPTLWWATASEALSERWVLGFERRAVSLATETSCRGCWEISEYQGSPSFHAGPKLRRRSRSIAWGRLEYVRASRHMLPYGKKDRPIWPTASRVRAKEGCDLVPMDFVPMDFPGKGLWCKACWCAALIT